MEKRVFAFRGAVCVDNTEESITNNVCLLCNELFAHNQLQADDVISLQFSITDDITVLNPATALRRGNRDRTERERILVRYSWIHLL